MGWMHYLALSQDAQLLDSCWILLAQSRHSIRPRQVLLRSISPFGVDQGEAKQCMQIFQIVWCTQLLHELVRICVST